MRHYRVASDALKFKLLYPACVIVDLFNFCEFQRIQFSKKDSDIIAKMKGTFVEGERRRKEHEDDHGRKKKKK